MVINQLSDAIARPSLSPQATVQRKIVGFHQDEAQDWVADLECGHKQHVRHQPPWLNRPWVISPEGRRSRLGYTLDCKHGDHGAHESAPPRQDTRRSLEHST